jgi:hypothetical protein
MADVNIKVLLDDSRAKGSLLELKRYARELEGQLGKSVLSKEDQAAILKRLGDVRGSIEDMKASVKNFDPGDKFSHFASVLQLGSTALVGVSAGMKIFGVESEKAAKIQEGLNNLIQAAVVAQTLLDAKRLKGMLTHYGNLTKEFVMNNLLIKQQGTLNALQSGYNKIITSLLGPVGLLVAAVGLLTFGFIKLAESMDKSSQQHIENKKTTDELTKSINEQIEKLGVLQGLYDEDVLKKKKAQAENEKLIESNAALSRGLAELVQGGVSTTSLIYEEYKNKILKNNELILKNNTIIAEADIALKEKAAKKNKETQQNYVNKYLELVEKQYKGGEINTVKFFDKLDELYEQGKITIEEYVNALSSIESAYNKLRINLSETQIELLSPSLRKEFLNKELKTLFEDFKKEVLSLSETYNITEDFLNNLISSEYLGKYIKDGLIPENLPEQAKPVFDKVVELYTKYITDYTSLSKKYTKLITDDVLKSTSYLYDKLIENSKDSSLQSTLLIFDGLQKTEDIEKYKNKRLAQLRREDLLNSNSYFISLTESAEYYKNVGLKEQEDAVNKTITLFRKLLDLKDINTFIYPMEDGVIPDNIQQQLVNISLFATKLDELSVSLGVSADETLLAKANFDDYFNSLPKETQELYKFIVGLNALNNEIDKTTEKVKPLKEQFKELGTSLLDTFAAGPLTALEIYSDRMEALFEESNNYLDESYNKQTEQMDKLQEYGIISNQELIDRKKKAEEEYEAKKKKLRIQEAKFNKKEALFQIAINTAVAVTKALSQGNYAQAIISGIEGALQATIVESKPIPTYKKGGLTGLLNGPSHEQGGITTNVGELEGGEFIINKQATMQNIPTLTSINSNGDLITTLINEVRVLQGLTANQKLVVPVESINKVQRDLVKIKEKAYV